MKINEFIKEINYSEQAIRVYNEMAVSEEEYALARELYYTNEEEFLNSLKQKTGDNFYPALLYYFTRFAVDIYPEYIKMGFSREQYIQTFSDFKTWNEMCILETGICGLKEMHWLTSHLHAGIIRLGRMQFQPDETEEDIVFKNTVIKAGEKVLNVHIPFGGAITPNEVENSLNLARKYFPNYTYVHAESWLLDPTLKDLLNENSNILSFAKRFTLYKIQQENSIERFIFKVVKSNKSEYVATTSFQKRVKEELEKGRKFYSGFGVLKLQ